MAGVEGWFGTGGWFVTYGWICALGVDGEGLVDGVRVAIIYGIVFFGALNNLRLFILLNFMPLEFLGLLWFFIHKPWYFEWH
ncbi:hypothetical protein [Bartonella sp. CL71SXKL]|uniref:hypothetical protein n=2 Tax=Bartonella TaxID=773 RepID=UPI0035D13535